MKGQLRAGLFTLSGILILVGSFSPWQEIAVPDAPSEMRLGVQVGAGFAALSGLMILISSFRRYLGKSSPGVDTSSLGFSLIALLSAAILPFLLPGTVLVLGVAMVAFGGLLGAAGSLLRSHE